MARSEDEGGTRGAKLRSVVASPVANTIARRRFEKVKKEITEVVKNTIDNSLAEAEEMMYSDGEDTTPEEYRLINEALALQREYLDPLNLSRYKTEALALGHAMLLGNVPASAEHARKVCEFLEAALPPLHPLVVLQVMTLAELLQEMGSNR